MSKVDWNEFSSFLHANSYTSLSYSTNQHTKVIIMCIKSKNIVFNAMLILISELWNGNFHVFYFSYLKVRKCLHLNCILKEYESKFDMKQFKSGQQSEKKIKNEKKMEKEGKEGKWRMRIALEIFCFFFLVFYF